MSERYRLVFRGEVLEGQHKAVVKQRLGVTLKLDGPRLDAIFTGKAVTIRKDADTDTAARFQIAFKRAGARLRVLPVDVEAAPVVESESPPPSEGGYRLAPAGALMAEPRPAPPPPVVLTDHLSLAAPGTALSAPRSYTATVPDVSHLTVAALGADLHSPSKARVAEIAPVAAPTWEVARVGVDLIPRSPPVEPPVGLAQVEFELAPPGALLMDDDDTTPPAPPDTSHLRLQ